MNQSVTISDSDNSAQDNDDGFCLDGYSQHQVPYYLAKNYWWAYLSPLGVSFFDHPFIVNRILWGQYHQIASDAVSLLNRVTTPVIAGISCAYGEFIPAMIATVPAERFYLFDVAKIQLEHAGAKIAKLAQADKVQMFLGNAESIALAGDGVDCSVLFYLLHELPESARARVLAEALRITKPGGRIIIADYAPRSGRHLFHRSTFFTGIFEKMEPFLANFWRCDLDAELANAAKIHGKSVCQHSYREYWHKFYRLVEYQVACAAQ